MFGIEDFHSLPSLPPGRRSTPDLWQHRRSAGALRRQRVGLGLVEVHQRSPGVRLEQFMPDEIVPVCAPRIPDPNLRRAIEGLKSVRDLEALPLVWRTGFEPCYRRERAELQLCKCLIIRDL